MNDTTRRFVLLAVPIACLAVILGAALVWRDELPDPMAIHWGTGGMADGFGPVWLTTVLFAALVLGLGVAPVLVQRGADGQASRWLGAMAAGVPGFLTVVHVGALQANIAAPTAADATLPDGVLLVGVGVLLVLGALGYWVSPEGDADASSLPVEEVAVVPGEAVVWSGRADAGPWLVALAGGIVVAGVALAMVTPAWNAVVLVLAGLAVGSILRLRVTVGPAGVVVRHGPLGLLRVRVALDDIEEVGAELVEPLAFGGWGYRLRPGVRAIIVRRGPGLRLERTDAPALVVTVDDAGVAAGVLRAHLAERAQS